MATPKKLILVTAEHHPYHSKWMKLAEEVSKELGLELEVKYEDYLFVIEHGVTDDLGMAGLPQLLVEYDTGEIKPVLHEVPLNEAYQADFEKAKEVVIEKLRESKQ
jgi:hypothetical protein